MSKRPPSFIDANKMTYLILSGMGAMALAFIIFCANWFFPLKEKVAVIETKIDNINITLGTINSKLAKAEAETKQAQEEVRASVNEDTLPALLKNTTEGKPEELKEKLPRARRYIAIAKENNLPSDPKVIRSRGLNLLKERKQLEDTALQQQVMLTASDIASFLTSLYAPLQQAVIEASKDKSIYFEGGTHTLRFNTPEGAVYKDTTVIYEGGRLDLSKVRFVNVKFEVPQNDQGVAFLQAVFNSGGQPINYHFPPLKPFTQQGKDDGS
ncbi:MAG TPA: hypothetical protein VK363_16590 [Pyrinomonadaceae bacterium]|nr:hypothetical protein [Pyrinomonadaceae bacterium]